MTKLSGRAPLALIIDGAPRSKKNSLRRIKRGANTFTVGSAAWKLWNDKAVWQLRAQRRGVTFAGPVNMAAVVYREKAVGDLLNFLAAVSDALEEAGIVTDDKFITQVDGSRLAKDADHPRVEIIITELA